MLKWVVFFIYSIDYSQGFFFFNEITLKTHTKKSKSENFTLNETIILLLTC